MVVQKRTLAYWGLAFVIVLSENYMYIIDPTSYIFGVPVLDIGAMLAIMWILGVVLCYGPREGVRYRFKWVILFTAVLAITSSLQSNILYGQGILLGLRPQRYFLIWAFSYFPLRMLLSQSQITYEKVIKLIYTIGIVELFLYIGQFIFGDYITIVQAKSNNVYESSRYYFNTIFLCLLLFICLNEVFNKRKIFKNSIIIVAVLFELLFVGKMRMTLLAVVFAIGIGFLLWKKGGSTKVLFFSAGIAAVFMVLNTEVIQSIIPTLRGEYKINTLAIRDIGRAFYIETIKEHPLLGGGYINTQWKPAYDAARVGDLIYWVDNGVFGFAYFYGLLGVGWMLNLLRKIYVCAYKLMVNRNNYIFFVMPIYWIVSCINEAHWYFCSFMVVVLYLCLLESELDSYEEQLQYYN